jgi:hypothetical protein
VVSATRDRCQRRPSSSRSSASTSGHSPRAPTAACSSPESVPPGFRCHTPSQSPSAWAPPIESEPQHVLPLSPIPSAPRRWPNDPYELRHAAVSLWLNAGVPPTQVAEWAGHSVNVLPGSTRCVYGQDEVTRIRIETAPALATAAEEPPVAVTSSRIPPERPKATGLTRSQRTTRKGPTTGVSAGHP